MEAEELPEPEVGLQAWDRNGEELKTTSHF